MDKPKTTDQDNSPVPPATKLETFPQNRQAALVSLAGRYGLALLLVAAAVLLTEALVSIGSRPSFGLFFLAALLGAWYGGFGPGILTTLLSALAGAYFFVPTAFTLVIGEGVVQTAVFTLVGLLTTFLAAQRRRAEAALREQREYYRVTLTSIGDAVIATDIRGRVTFMNAVSEALTAWPLAEARGRPLEEVFRIVNETTRAVVDNPVRRVLESGYIVGLANHTILLARDGREIPIDDSAAPVRANPQGQISGVILVFRDVAERRQAELKLEQSLREKEVLLREINHRVKNNLMAISNLLYMQSQTISDPQVRQKFENMQNRIKSISLIHEKLYLTQNLARIDFGDYIDSLVTHLIQSYRVEPGQIRIKRDCDDLDLGTDVTVTLGIIVNELVSNTLKHGFPDNRPGEIEIALKALEDGCLKLAVKDNGVGFPEDKDVWATGSMGLQLVQMLAGHMDGTVELERNGGTSVMLTFRPLQEAA